MHPNFDKQISNVQQIYGVPSKRKRLDKLSPTKSTKKGVLALDIEGESKPIVIKKKPGNIFQQEDPLIDLELKYYIS